MINLGNVKLNEKAIELVNKCLQENKIGQTEYIERFEEKFAKFLGVKYAIAVSSGTMADTIALAVLKDLYPYKKKVIVPSLTFIAQINSIIYNGLEPIFVDSNEWFDFDDSREILCPDEILCIFPVHLLGKPQKWANGHVPVIEDTCEALGSKLNNQYCGTIGDMGTFSFFPSHTLTTGEGGMIVTNNEEYFLLAKKLRNHGKIRGDEFHFDVIGFNGKITSIQAAIGIGMMEDLPEMIEKRNQNFIKMGGSQEKGEFIVPHGFPSFYKNRDEKMEELKNKGIDCRNFFSSIPTQEKAYKYLEYKLGDFPQSEYIGRRGLYVPCHQYLTNEEIDYIKNSL